ncbi:hypothetical protein PSHT_06639 [Puccinia striiformis]|uniref:Uncharacterized protein n=1 Tax=Puccinia striiformis TaxID=27350 RepID=A0A2S4W4A4_9BASI|nr:hypothetical protein PSHT_06639 [Puccinia striiformis]
MNFLGSAILFVALAGPFVAGQQYFRCGAAAPHGHCGSNNSHAVPPTWDITYIYQKDPDGRVHCPGGDQFLLCCRIIGEPGFPNKRYYDEPSRSSNATWWHLPIIFYCLLQSPFLTVSFGSLSPRVTHF